MTAATKAIRDLVGEVRAERGVTDEYLIVDDLLKRLPGIADRLDAEAHTADVEHTNGAREALRNVWDAMMSPHAVGMDVEATKNACAQVERVAREMGVEL